MSFRNGGTESVVRAALGAPDGRDKRSIGTGNRVVPMAVRELLDGVGANWRVVQHPPLDTIDQGLELGIADILGCLLKPVQIPGAGGCWRPADTPGGQGHNAS